jgi:hypothetical protein
VETPYPCFQDIPGKRALNNHNLKPDISNLAGIGHFYFGWTKSEIPLQIKDVLEYSSENTY